MKKQTISLVKVLFPAYCAVMVYLLFLQRGYDYQRLDYWRRVGSNMNLIPFATISQFFSYAARGIMPRFAIINLAGNVVMFIPLGIFLPVLWPSLRSFWRFLLAVSAVIALVELIQLFSLLGSGDIDDLILNLAGASLGFCALRVIRA